MKVRKAVGIGMIAIGFVGGPLLVADGQYRRDSAEATIAELQTLIQDNVKTDSAKGGRALIDIQDEAFEQKHASEIESRLGTVLTWTLIASGVGLLWPEGKTKSRVSRR